MSPEGKTDILALLSLVLDIILRINFDVTSRLLLTPNLSSLHDDFMQSKFGVLRSSYNFLSL